MRHVLSTDCNCSWCGDLPVFPGHHGSGGSTPTGWYRPYLLWLILIVVTFILQSQRDADELRPEPADPHQRGLPLCPVRSRLVDDRVSFRVASSATRSPTPCPSACTQCLGLLRHVGLAYQYGYGFCPATWASPGPSCWRRCCSYPILRITPPTCSRPCLTCSPSASAALGRALNTLFMLIGVLPLLALQIQRVADSLASSPASRCTTGSPWASAR